MNENIFINYNHGWPHARYNKITETFLLMHLNDYSIKPKFGFIHFLINNVTFGTNNKYKHLHFYSATRTSEKRQPTATR